MEKKSWKGYWYLLPALVIILVFTVYPLIKALMISFLEGYSIINGGYDRIGLSNYSKLFQDGVFRKSLVNTGIYVVFVVPCSILFSLLIAVLLNGRIKGKGLFQTLFFLPYVTSVIAIGIVWSWIFNSSYGLLNYLLGFLGIEPVQWLNSPDKALWALIIFSIWKSMAFNILIFLAGLQTISQDLYHAARVDATPGWRVFTKITVPGIAPMLAYAFTMGLISAFKVYNEVFSLFKGKAGPANSASTVVYYIYDKFYNSANYGVAAAAAVVLFCIILLLTLMQMRAGEKRAAA